MTHLKVTSNESAGNFWSRDHPSVRGKYLRQPVKTLLSFVHAPSLSFNSSVTLTQPPNFKINLL